MYFADSRPPNWQHTQEYKYTASLNGNTQLKYLKCKTMLTIIPHLVAGVISSMQPLNNFIQNVVISFKSLNI